MSRVLESDLEEVCLEWFADLGYEVLEAHNFVPDSVYTERNEITDVILHGRLETAIRHLNAEASEDAIQQAIRVLTRTDAPTLVQNNEDFHRHLVDGIEVEVSAGNGQIRGVQIRVADFENPDENDWLVAQQFTVVDRATGTGQERRPDLIVFLNGLPVAVLELKNPADESADVWGAFRQLQTYKEDIPSLFVSNCVLVISDDVEARIGSLTAPASRFGPWRTIDGDSDAPKTMQPLDVLVQGVFHKERFLDLVRNFVTYEVDKDQIIKKVAAYHQFHAVRRAVTETVRASGPKGDQRVGVIWHTQGSGKSLSMLFYARKLILDSAMANPTIVVLTDRNDLDNQLFGTFSSGQALLRQEPKQAEGRDELQSLLQTESGGVYFTTVQKFLPEGETYPALSQRRNIVVMADEAHRSQYGYLGKVNRKTGEMKYGFAKHLRDALPNASFVGFTGTPVELGDKNTVQAFGDYISIYDIRKAVEDGATVPIFYENRLAKIELDEEKKLALDPDFEEVTEGEEEEAQEALKSHWAALEKLVGTDQRMALVAKDMVEHYEARVNAMEGKALIVCMSRKICARLYREIIALRPEWHSDEDDAGAIKVVMTGSAADEALLKPHIRSKKARERLADRFRDKDDPLRLVIVRDMWLTGFDAPCLHTLYVDKPMRGHNLMQAIARVNRVFGDKPGGLVVDYIGIAPFLQEAMNTYTQSGGEGDATEQQEQAVKIMLEQIEVCRDLYHGFDYSLFLTGEARDRLALLPAAREHILEKRKPKKEGEKGKKKDPDDFDRFLEAVTKLSKAFALASPHDECNKIVIELAFFQAIKAGVVKLTKPSLKGRALDQAIRQIVSNAVVSDEVIDIFSAAGLEKPDISILSDEFLEDVRNLEHKNLAAELLARLLKDEVSARSRRSVIQKRSFQELLEKAIRRYQNRSVETAQVIEELIEIARKLRDAGEKGKELGLNNDEYHFYEALADSESASDIMGDKALASIARGLTELVRKNTSIDWQYRKNAQAKLRVMVKKQLRKEGYPPDEAVKATETVLEQAKILGINFVDGASEAEPTTEPAEAAKPKRARPLPYPIAVFDSLVASQGSQALRVKTRVDGIEKAIAFVVATEMAFLRDANGGTMPESVLKVLGGNYGKPVSFGTWLEYAWRLAALISADSTDPVARAARSLVNEKGKPSDIVKELQKDVVPYRNKFAHGVVPSEQEIAPYEKPMHEVWARLKTALAPLSEAELVSMSEILNLGKDDTQYKLRMMQGPSDHFPLEERTMKTRLEKHWCYLLRDGEPLLLAPIALCRYRSDAGRNEVYLARSLGKDAGDKVELMALTGSDTVKVALP